MWLINPDTIRLEYFMSPDPGSYAILSHSWEAEEVSFQMFSDSVSAETRPGEGKRSTEAINSMFKWYHEAAVCFVFLSDISTGTPDGRLDGTYTNISAGQLGHCKWLKRSWTLQELLAPLTTTRPEDMAYCLLGIFDINMPMLYGEGHKAFLRLQKEICKQTNDLSLFARTAQPDHPLSSRGEYRYSPLRISIFSGARAAGWR
ncbi:heterokaryon incompatibility protein-domain-containing protein [Hypoxylon crocopeplum]|nr:heterokaryon incompatibility protein-domain-containing protein [Hypoxylon crocopeplum]